MRPGHDESPFNALPASVVVLALFFFGVEMALQLGARGLIGGPNAIGWRIALMREFAVIPELFRTLWEMGLWPLEHLLRLVIYPCVHGSFTQMVFVVVFVLALGKLVGEQFGPWTVIAIFVGSSVLAALLYLLIVPGNQPLVGGFPGAYGLIGAYTFILWVFLGQLGQQQSRAFSLIGFLMAIQLVFGLLFGGGYEWIADLAGFAAGFALSIVLSPGGIAGIRDKLRQR